MNDEELINPRAREFAGLIKNIMEPLTQNQKFLAKFKDRNRKFLINASNLNYAALLTIDDGFIKVESVSNKFKANLKRKALGWDGFISMDSQTFIALAMDKISIVSVLFKWIMGKVKLKGILNLITLLKIFNLLKS
jgi:hypothetical protein